MSNRVPMFAALTVIVLSSAMAADPAPPQTFIDTTYVPPTGSTITVNAGGNLQTAINAANPGDVINVQAGATFTGNFTLPVKSGSGWVTIRSSSSALPAPGTRVTPADAANMPKLIAPIDIAALATSGAAHHYRLIGLEISTSYNISYGLVTLGTGSETSAAQLPHDLIVDRCYIHGSGSAQIQNGIRMNSAMTAVIDSCIDDCHATQFESHCIGGHNGTGPYKITNNFLGGSCIQCIFGGAIPSLSGAIASDIEFRYNHCIKPLSWRPGDPSYAGTEWYIKNLFELKCAQRVLVEGNVFEQNWVYTGATPDGSPQAGFAMLFTVRDNAGATPYCVVQDVYVHSNIIRKSNAGISFYGQEGQGAHRIKVENNLLDDIGLNWGNNDRSGMFMQTQDMPDLTVNHNTVIHDGDIQFATGTNNVGGYIVTNNIFNHGCARTVNTNWGVNGVGTNIGFPTFTAFFTGTPSYVFTKNAMANPTFDPTSRYPANNYFPAAWSNVGFTDFAGGNYRLAATSPYKNLGTDGKDLGCDIDALNAALNPNPPVTYTLTVNSGSGSGSYAAGTAVTITANAAPSGQVFNQWTGASVANAASATTTLIMPAANASVTATYKTVTTLYTLTVNSGSGSGSYAAGTVVNITANAAPSGQVFNQWTGASVASATSATTTLTMPAANTSVTATYKTVTTLYTLTVNSGSGSGSYAAGTVVTITANAAPSGQVFNQWTGASVANAASATTTLTMPAANTSVTATYKTVTTLYTLTVNSGSGSGSYAAGTVVTITANAAPSGQVFSQWTGASVASATSATTTLTMPAANTSVTATYVAVNSPPVITSQATATPNPAIAGATVTFVAGASDSNGDPLTYAWSFGDGSSGSAASATHAYAAAGTYTASVTVTDGRGGSASSSVSVVVNPPITGKVMYISAIGISGAAVTGGYKATGVVHIAGANGLPLSGVRVAIAWSGATKGTTSKTTTTAGTVTFLSARSIKGGTFTITVTGVARTGYTYRKDLNVTTTASVKKP